jgi:hypothetical protein
MKNYKILFLLFLSSCGGDEKAATSKPIDTKIGDKVIPVDASKIVKPQVISPEKAYLDKIKTNPEVWYISELASFSFIAKKQADLANDINDIGALDMPLNRFRFLTQLHGLRAILSYMRLPLSRINRGDTAFIRSHALEAAKLTYYAKKTSQVGEAMLFSERAKEAYLRINELSNRELLKPQVSSPFVPAELGMNIYKALEHVHNIFDDLEVMENTTKKELTEHILMNLEKATKSIKAIQSQTDGLGYNLVSPMTSSSTALGITPPGMKGPMGGSKNLSMLTQGMGGGTAQGYGLPSASSLLQAGSNGSSAPQSYTNPMPMQQNTSTQNNFLSSFSTPIPPSRAVSSTLGTEAAVGPYGAQNPAPTNTIIPRIPTSGNISPQTTLTSPQSALPTLGALFGGNYSGAPQSQPTPPINPENQAPPALPPPSN